MKLNEKSEIVSRYVKQQEILYEDGRLGAEFQFISQDLDQEEYTDKHEIMNPVPVLWLGSPVLYSYCKAIECKATLQRVLNSL